MLELDLMLQRFIEQYLSQLDEPELASFELLLTYPDPDLFSWLMGSQTPDNKELSHIIALIQLHSGVSPV
jgi:antitoxin CptB